MTNGVPQARLDALETERDHMREQLRQLGHDRDRDTFDEGFADSGQVTAERGEVEALVNTLLEALDDVERALGKVEAGSYGACEGCGDAIPDARLEANPAARLCIGCASQKR